jgi:ubiquitination network signaling protein AcrB
LFVGLEKHKLVTYSQQTLSLHANVCAFFSFEYLPLLTCSPIQSVPRSRLGLGQYHPQAPLIFMPRTSGKKNQHNGRHENGLVGPGKRISKQKSNGHINGSARGAASEDTAQFTSSPSLPLNGQTANESNASAPDAKRDTLLDPRSILKHQDPETSIDGQDNSTSLSMAQNGPIDGKHRRSDAVPPKTKLTYDINPVHLASTILRSCPGTDTVALLIFLLALPSMMLTIIQAFFASLTFMPPNGFTPGTLWSFLDLFQSPAGAPSLVTMTVVDLICCGAWFCLWTWARRFALDLAQVQIAMTLGGGGSGKGGGVNSVCVALVLLVHLVRSRGVRDFFFGNIMYARLSAYPSVASFLQYLPSQADFGDSPETPSTIRSLIAIHIIAQAMMALIRRWVANTPGTATVKSSKRTDPEALAGTQNTQELQTVDSIVSLGSSSGVDYQPPPTPGLKDGKEKGVSAKKRRRQANQVRSRQPFWAALASTKVHVMREYEHTRGNYKTSGGQDATTQDAVPGDELVWITGVDSSTIQFEASNIGVGWQEQDAAELEHCNKPITVRINGAEWTLCLEEISDSQDSSSARWRGEIQQLVPNCTYECSFSRTHDKTDFACISIKTPAISDKDLPKALAPIVMRHPGQPSSPTTTIKTSIQSSEAKLAESRNRMTKARRTHKATLARVEKEVETLGTRLKSSSDDKKQHQKLLQAERSIKQTEEAIARIDSQLEDLAAIPEEDSEEYSMKKKDFQERNASLTAANGTLETAKASASTDSAAANADLQSVVERKKRLVARQARLTEQYDRITEANAQGLNEKERKAAESTARAFEEQKAELDFQQKFVFLQNELDRYRESTMATWQAITTYENQMRAQQDAMFRNDGSLTPEGNLPGTNPFSSGRSVGFPFAVPTASIHAAMTMSPVSEQPHSPFLAYANTLPDGGGARRARSGTNRSIGAGSNFSAEFDDADPIPPMPTNYEFDYKGANGRKGSGSSRGKNNDNGSPGVIGAGLSSPIRGRNSPAAKSFW